jgi:hypothetical protein
VGASVLVPQPTYAGCDLAEHESRVPDEDLSGGRQSDRTGAPIDERPADGSLEGFEVPAHGGLREAQLEGGLLEAPVIRHCDEGSEPSQIEVDVCSHRDLSPYCTASLRYQ